MGLRRDVKRTVCKHRRTVNRSTHANQFDLGFVLAMIHDQEISVFVTQENLPVNHQSRAPNTAKGIISPIHLARIGIETMDDPRILAR